MAQSTLSDSAKLYDAQKELLIQLSQAEEDVRQGRVAPMQTTFDAIRAELAAKAANEHHA